MKFYIPEIGDQIKLKADWKFNLYYEYRNQSLIKYFTGVDFTWNNVRYNTPGPSPVTLPKGTILQVDRIYIRKGSSDYSSITFYAKELPSVVKTAFGKPNCARFWAKLSDCNTIEFEKVIKK